MENNLVGTMRCLRYYIGKSFSIWVDISTLRKYVKKHLGLSFKKSRLEPERAPDIATQKKYIRKLVKYSKSKDCILLFFDPVHQMYNTENGRSWQVRGGAHTKKIKSKSGRKRLNILGSINPGTMDTIIMTTEHKCDGLMMEAYLGELKKELETRYGAALKSKKIYLVMDNAPYNRSYITQNAAKELGIRLIFLPVYSPNLNLIERLWKFMKKKVTGNIYYETYDGFYQAICDFFKNLKENYREELKSLMTMKFEILNAA